MAYRGRRLRIAFVLVSVLALVSVDTRDVAAAADPAATLRQQVTAALRKSTAAARGMVVVVEGRGTVVDIGGDAVLPPASTQKLYTAGAALVQLDPEWRMRTEVRATAPNLDGVVGGDLVLVAGGDPTLTGAHLDAMAATVAGAGVREVQGSLYIDDTRFDRSRSAPGWKPGWVPRESGPLSAFSVDRNQWRRDAAFLADPALGNGERFRGLLAAHGVHIAGTTVIGAAPADAVEVLATHASPPVGELVHSMLKASDNFTSEMLLKEVGAASGGGSTTFGLDTQWRVAATLGITPSQAADASGLSAHNRSSAWHQVRWLMALDSHRAGALVRSALPVGCIDGTLRTRFCRAPGAGRVAAKTGTLNGVTALTGMTTTAAGNRVWFSAMTSGARSVAKARAAIDAAVNAIVASQL